MAFECFHVLVGIGTAGTDEHAAGVAERGSLHNTGAALAGNLIALCLLQDRTLFNHSVDEEHSGEGAGVIAHHSNNSVALGTLHLLVSLLFQ